MSNNLELGQMAFGNPTGDYGTPEFVDALVDYLLNEIERVYWNKYQQEWNREDDPMLKGVIYNSYYWGDDEKEANKPNLAFQGLKQEIRCYKHFGRGQSSSLKYTEKSWRGWFDKAVGIINQNERSSD